MKRLYKIPAACIVYLLMLITSAVSYGYLVANNPAYINTATTAITTMLVLR